MKQLLLFAVLIVVSSPMIAAARHQIHSKRSVELCAIKKIAIEGNSESAVNVRKQLEKRTWLALSDSSASADAVLKVNESRSEKNFPIRTERTTVSAEMVKSDGSVVWSGSSWFDEGVFNSGSGSAVKILLSNLQKSAGCQR